MADTGISSFNRMMNDPERAAGIKKRRGDLAASLEQKRLDTEKEIASLQTGTQLAIHGPYESRDALERWKTIVAHGKSQYGISGDVEAKLAFEKEQLAANKEVEKQKNVTNLVTKGFTPEGQIDLTNPHGRIAVGQADYLTAANRAIMGGKVNALPGPMGETIYLDNSGVATPRSSGYQVDPEKVKATGR